MNTIGPVCHSYLLYSCHLNYTLDCWQLCCKQVVNSYNIRKTYASMNLSYVNSMSALRRRIARTAVGVPSRRKFPVWALAR